MNKHKIMTMIIMGISMVGSSLTGYALDARTESRYVVENDKNMHYSSFEVKNIINVSSG